MACPVLQGGHNEFSAVLIKRYRLMRTETNVFAFYRRDSKETGHHLLYKKASIR